MIQLDYAATANDANLEDSESGILGLLIDFVCHKAEWKCWQTGVELKYLGFTLISIEELLQDNLIDNRDGYVMILFNWLD